jgi:hypothetical protein
MAHIALLGMTGVTMLSVKQRSLHFDACRVYFYKDFGICPAWNMRRML